MNEPRPPLDRTEVRVLLAGVRDLGRLSAGMVADRFSELVEAAIDPGIGDPASFREASDRWPIGDAGFGLVDAVAHRLAGWWGGDGMVERIELPAVHPGATSEGEAWIHNDGSEPTGVLSVWASTLVAAGGESMPAGTIAVAPDSFTVDPGGAQRLVVRLDVPAGSTPGRYRGLLLSSDPGAEPIVVAVDVRGIA